MDKANQHLSYKDRISIASLIRNGLTQKDIAEDIGCYPSTISRELKRNSDTSGKYDGEQAHLRAQTRCSKANTRPNANTAHLFLEYEQWQRQCAKQKLCSPGTYHGVHTQVQGQPCLSRSWLYELVARDRRNGGDLFRFLPREGKPYQDQKHVSDANSSLIPNRRDISERPAEVDTRKTFGHWEMDTIIGRHHQGVILTMVERVSRYTFLVLLPSKAAWVIQQAIVHMLNKEQRWVHTITADNGFEFAAHEAVTKALGALVYFCKPFTSWQRGTVENINGLVRRRFPKGTAFEKLTKAEVQKVQDELNDRAFECLG